jgi:hypothetical protein
LKVSNSLPADAVRQANPKFQIQKGTYASLEIWGLKFGAWII